MVLAHDVLNVVGQALPLYVIMFVAYVVMKWAKLFTTHQASGINKFVAKFGIPLWTFKVIAETNPYNMSLRLFCADTLQKVLVLMILAVITKVTGRGVRWVTTGFALSTMTNAIIIGIPLMEPMYGDVAKAVLAQIVVMGSVIWNNAMIFLYELCVASKVSDILPTEAPGVDDASKVENNSETIPAKTKQIRRILTKVGREMVTNYNIIATLLGLIWAFISFRWHLRLPFVIKKSVEMISDGTLGMAMFSTGFFMALRPKIIACGPKKALLALSLRFIYGPAMMTATSLASGLRGTILKVAIMQAALPQAIVTYVFAEEYGVEPEIMSASVVLTTLMAIPVVLLYYLPLQQVVHS